MSARAFPQVPYGLVDRNDAQSACDPRRVYRQPRPYPGERRRGVCALAAEPDADPGGLRVTLSRLGLTRRVQRLLPRIIFVIA